MPELVVCPLPESDCIRLVLTFHQQVQRITQSRESLNISLHTVPVSPVLQLHQLLS